LQIFLRSLLIRVRERSVMELAICCRLVAMAGGSCEEVVGAGLGGGAEVMRYQELCVRESIGGCGSGGLDWAGARVRGEGEGRISGAFVRLLPSSGAVGDCPSCGERTR
jgi:hypothetical protein